MLKCLLIVTAGLASFIPSSAMASVTAMNSYAQVSEDGTRILVMVSPAVEYDTITHPVPFFLPDGRTVSIRDTFVKSGCYDAGTLAPLWQVEWYDFPYCLRWSPDFSSVVRLNPRGIEPDNDWALAFYHDGQLIKEYDCAFLLTGLRHLLLFELSFRDWYLRWHDEFEVEGNRLDLSTARRRLCVYGLELDLGLQEFYEFDLATGEVVSFRSEGGWVVWAYLGGCLMLLVSAALLIIWMLKRMKSPIKREG
jgi:hypothetical protein